MKIFGKRSLTGLTLMAFGGPETRSAIGPFMANLMGREPSPEVLAAAVAKYDLIGGSSPLPTITGRQAAGVQRRLAEMGHEIPVAVGMRYWRPYIETAVRNLAAEGVDRLIALSMSPHYSRVSIGAYEEELDKARESFPGVGIEQVEGWYAHPGFLAAVAEKVEEGLARLGGDVKPHLVFTAHSLPVAHIDEGEPYVEQVEMSVAGVKELVGDFDHTLAYQSRGRSPGPWLGPEAGDVLAQLAEAGVEEILLVPIGFVADHLETLYDIDIELRKRAESLGLRFERSASLNDSPTFIGALADIVKERLE